MKAEFTAIIETAPEGVIGLSALRFLAPMVKVKP